MAFLEVGSGTLGSGVRARGLQGPRAVGNVRDLAGGLRVLDTGAQQSLHRPAELMGKERKEKQP